MSPSSPKSRAARASRGVGAVLGFVALAMIGTALVVAQPWMWCPSDWSDAARVHLSSSGGYVVLDGREFQVGGGALLDYMPRVVTSPLDQMRAGHHPLSIYASISAISRDALGEPVFTCFRVARGSDVWARRPTTYGIQTMADGYPPGAPSPIPNNAWRMASINDGPEWPDGDRIDLELWATVGGRHYVFVLPPFALMRGGQGMRFVVVVLLLVTVGGCSAAPASPVLHPQYRYVASYAPGPFSPGAPFHVQWTPELVRRDAAEPYDIRLCVGVFGAFESASALKEAGSRAGGTRPDCPAASAAVSSGVLRTRSDTGNPLGVDLVLPVMNGLYEVRQIAINGVEPTYSAMLAGGVIEVRGP